MSKNEILYALSLVILGAIITFTSLIIIHDRKSQKEIELASIQATSELNRAVINSDRIIGEATEDLSINDPLVSKETNEIIGDTVEETVDKIDEIVQDAVEEINQTTRKADAEIQEAKKN